MYTKRTFVNFWLACQMKRNGKGVVKVKGSTVVEYFISIRDIFSVIFNNDGLCNGDKRPTKLTIEKDTKGMK